MTGTAQAPERPAGTGGARSRRQRWAVRAAARGAWAGQRWWLPGTVAAAVAGLVAWQAMVAGTAFVEAGCGEPGAKFECLGTYLLAAALGPVLVPLLLWLLYRTVGVRHPVLAVPVAAVAGFCLLAAPELVREVRLLGGTQPGYQAPPAWAVGALAGLAVLGGGLALQGPRRAVRALAGGAALGLLVGSTLALAGPAERAATALQLQRAEVPLLLPGDGWRPSGVYVGQDGTLHYDAVPPGWEGHGFQGLDVDVTRDLSGYADTCGFRECTDVGDVRVEVPQPDGTGGPTAWRVVDGVLVTVTSYGEAPEVDPAAFLQGMTPVPAEEVVRRERHD